MPESLATVESQGFTHAGLSAINPQAEEVQR